jgi:uncharacterized protein YndB with AHSA1/START domain
MSGEPFRHQLELAAPPEKVFPYLTRSDLLLVWMGDHAVLEPWPGGEFTVDINGVPVRGRFVVVDPPRRLVLTWGHAGSEVLPPGSSTVEITLDPTATGTLLTLEHRDLPPEEAPQHAIGWPHFLGRLSQATAGLHPGPDPFAQDASWALGTRASDGTGRALQPRTPGRPRRAPVPGRRGAGPRRT